MRHLSDGPIVTVTHSCSGCKHERSESYYVQSDSGQHVECRHPEAPAKNYIGDTTWTTPVWCPVLKAQQPAQAAADARDAERLDALARPGWELSMNNDPECWHDELWQVHRVSGGRNDREWHLIGQGSNPRAAIDAAIATHHQRQDGGESAA